MTERNEDLFRQIADLIEDEPERYDQTVYHLLTDCGTTGCIAGHAIMINGWQFEESGCVYAPGTNRNSDCSCGNLNIYAAELLGLTSDEADVLFSPGWAPSSHLNVPDALRKLGAGADISEVTWRKYE